MPKLVDHDQRKAELAGAVWRIASRDCLDAVTIRAVATEAGWSTGAVNHYFQSKEELLLLAFRTTAARVERRVAAATGEATQPSELLRILVAEGLPLDDERRAEARVWFAFLGLALTRPGLARAQRVAYRAWRMQLAQTLSEAQERGEVDPELDAEREAIELIAFADGLAVQAAFEPRALTPARMLKHLDERLARIRTR